MENKDGIIKYFSPGISLLSISMAIPLYIMAAMFVGRETALLFSLLFAAGLMIAMPVVMHMTDRKYRDIDEKVNGKIVLREVINFRKNDVARSGYFILTKERIYFFGRDKKPYVEDEIEKSDIVDMEIANSIYLNIYTKEDKLYQIIAGSKANILYAMENSGWIEGIQEGEK